MASHSCGHAPEKALYNIAYNKQKDETSIFLKADREVLSMKTELITCGGRQSLHVIPSGNPHPGHGMFEPWGKGHFPSMEESEQLKIWRDKNFEKTMNKVICHKLHRTAASARKCAAKIPGSNWTGYKPHLMRASRPHVNAIWRSGYYSIPFEPNEEGGPLPVPSTSLPSLVKELAKINQYKRDRRCSHTSISSDTSSTLDDSQSSRVPALPKECTVGRSADNPIQIHDESPSLSQGGHFSFERDGVEAEVSSFSFKLKNPKGIRPSVHDELILRGLGSPHKECRNAANDLLLMKQTHRSYTQNQLKRRENKFIDIFLSGKNFPTPEDVEKDLFSPYKPLRDAARALFLNKNNSDPAGTAQIYNKGLVEQYKEEQSKKNMQQTILDREEAQKTRREAQLVKKEAQMAKSKGLQITNSVSWDPELWEAIDCEDPYVKMWAVNYHKMLLKNVPSYHPDMVVAIKALNSALKEYKERVKQEVAKDQEKLDELKLTKELRDLYLVQQGEEGARAPEAQLSAPQREQPEATFARPPSPITISDTPEVTDDDEIPMLVAEAMEDFAPDNMLNKGNLDIPLKQESEQE